jgi:hypothetical protein
MELADLFCGMARLRVEALFHGLWHNQDDLSYKTAQKALGGRYTFIEQGILDPAELIERGAAQLQEAAPERDPALAT